MTYPLSIADLPVYIWLRSHVYRSYPHIALLTMQTRTQGFAPLSTRSLSLYGCISARVSPTYNLTVLYNYSQRSAFVKFPCKRFSLSTIATIRQWHLFLPHVLHADRKTDTQKRAKLDLGYLFDDLKHELTKTYHFEAWYKHCLLWK